MDKINLKQILEPVNWDKGCDHMNGVEKRNWATIEELDKQAKALGSLQGRYVSIPQADGHAVYMITKQNKASVVVEVCTGLGDDWVNPIWGYKATVKVADVMRFINFRDGMAKIFAKK